MSSCIVCGRPKNAKAKSANITFRRFPLKDTYKDKWYNFLVVNVVVAEKVSKLSLICSLHLEESCFVLKKDRRLLLKHAVPCKTVDGMKYAKQEYLETVTTLPVIKTFDNSSASDSVDIVDSTVSLNVSRTFVKCSWSNTEVEGVFSLYEPVTLCSNQSRKEEEEEVILSLDNSSVSVIDCETVTPNKKISNLLDSSTMSINTEIMPDDTPCCIVLKISVCQLSNEVSMKNIEVKTLQKKNKAPE